MAVRIVSLHVYPVKSLRGIDQGVAELTPLGLAHDRAWLVIDGAGRFLSQREAPEMARIATELHDDRLVLRREGMEDCAVPLSGVSGARRETKVWDDRCEVEDQGQEAARWLAGALDTDLELRLVRMAAGFRREERRRDRYGEGVSLFFADTAPFLVANTGSLDRLNEAHAKPVTDADPPLLKKDGTPAGGGSGKQKGSGKKPAK